MWDDILSNVIGVIVGALGTLVIGWITKLYKRYKTIEKLEEKQKENEKTFYKQSLWNFYYRYLYDQRTGERFKRGEEPHIPPEQYAFAENCYNKYKEVSGNGTTQFEFEEIKRIYERQQKQYQNGEVKKNDKDC